MQSKSKSKSAKSAKSEGADAAAAAAEASKRADGVRALRDAARRWGDATRDRVCTPARGFAGKPSDYVYDLKESCTLADPKARAEAQKRAKQRAAARKAGATVPSVAATRRELAQLDRVVNLHYGGLMPVDEAPMSPSSLPLFVNLMLRPSERLAQPDPELRYAAIARQFAKLDQKVPGRFTVLSLVKVALHAGLGEIAYTLGAAPPSSRARARARAAPSHRKTT
jgi:hypothetical protein